jgi:hypothetical protein
MTEAEAKAMLASGEKTVTQGAATDGSIEEFIAGESYQEGGRFDANDRGMGSGVGEPQIPGNYAEPEAPPQEAPFVQQTGGGEAPQDFKKMYGDSENEKGEWRRTATEAMQQLEQLKAELGSMRAAYAQPPQAPVYQPPQMQYAQPQMPQAQPQPQVQFPDTYFPGKAEGDFLEPSDVDSVFQRVDAAVQNLQQQGFALYQQQLQFMKTQAGIDPQTEQRIASQHPWIAQMPEGPAKVQAMQKMVQVEQAKPPARPTAPTPVKVSPEQAAARRVTYIENNQQKSHTEAEIPVQQRVAQEMAAAKTAFEKRKVLEKYGMGTANDWGAGFLTR